MILEFSPDSSQVANIVPSPNFGPRRDKLRPDILLLHYTGMATAKAAIQWLAAPQSQVSSHYLIDESGCVTQMVPEAKRAWHAGVSQWHGVSDINSCSIGIEIHNPGHDLRYPDFSELQMSAVELLCLDIIRRYGMKPQRILAHSDVAPGRKIDPGEKFDWERLASAGVGHWVPPVPIRDGENLGFGSSGGEVFRLQRQLHAYGYWIEPTGVFDAHTKAVTAAFQRHFRPTRADGIADRSTVETLDGLLAALPAT